MLQGYTHKQALRMYRTYGVRVAVALGSAALRKARAANAKRVAGLAELAFVQQPYVRRGTFESNESFNAWLLQARAEVHNAAIAAEV